jgi:transposase
MRESSKFPPKVIERKVRAVAEHRGQYEWQCAGIMSIAANIGCTAETLR